MRKDILLTQQLKCQNLIIIFSTMTIHGRPGLFKDVKYIPRHLFRSSIIDINDQASFTRFVDHRDMIVVVSRMSDSHLMLLCSEARHYQHLKIVPFVINEITTFGRSILMCDSPNVRFVNMFGSVRNLDTVLLPQVKVAGCCPDTLFFKTCLCQYLSPNPFPHSTMVHLFSIIPVGAFVGMIIMLLLYIAIIACLVIYTLVHTRLFGRSSLLSDGLVEHHRQPGSAAAIVPRG